MKILHKKTWNSMENFRENILELSWNYGKKVTTNPRFSSGVQEIRNNQNR